MKRFAMLALVLVFGISCDDSPTTSSDPNVQRFTAILLPGNEVAPFGPNGAPATNADAGASGTMQLIMTVTRDSANNISGATYDFIVHVTGFPANTTLTGAHIHNAGPGVNASVVVGLPLTSSDTALATGQATITKNAVQITTNAAQIAQGIVNNPGANYFNVHTSVNGGGAIRGQLVRQD